LTELASFSVEQKRSRNYAMRRPRVNIFICTRDRCRFLASTLASIGSAIVPADLPTELVVVDNGSTDTTREVVASAKVTNMAVRYRYEPRPGKSSALNLAMRETAGDILLHTDDDVRVPVTWIDDMCRSIADGKAHAMAGSIRMACHLERPWMGQRHRDWLLEYDFTRDETSGVMIGANMAFSRKVLDIIKGFDPELGPGRLGFSDDVLLSWMIQRTGYVIHCCRGPAVEHHFDPERLTRESLLRRALIEGRISAYLFHHWLQSDFRFISFRLIAVQIALASSRFFRLPFTLPVEGCPEWELNLQMKVGFWRQYSVETRRPRKYSDDQFIRR
jgi:glycosyltransferase involved in cell wall biosynthesis